MKKAITIILAISFMSLAALQASGQSSFLDNAVKELDKKSLSKATDKPNCVCGGDGKGGWECKPAGCDGKLNYFGSSKIRELSRGKRRMSSDPICVCRGDGKGSWVCTPAGCDTKLGQPTLKKPMLVDPKKLMTMDPKKPPMGKTSSDPICVCRGDGKGSWVCTPAGCDVKIGKPLSKKPMLADPKKLMTMDPKNPPKGETSSNPICVCRGDGTGAWVCTPAGCG